MNEKIPATTDKLRIAIDREGQGDKVDFPDPAAAPLGTDAEASDNPPGHEELAMEPIEPAGRARAFWVGPVVYAGIALVILCGFVWLASMASG